MATTGSTRRRSDSASITAGPSIKSRTTGSHWAWGYAATLRQRRSTQPKKPPIAAGTIVTPIAMSPQMRPDMCKATSGLKASMAAAIASSTT